MRRSGPSVLLAAGLFVLPGVARAHLVTSGLGPYYDGVLHLLMSPVDLLGLIAVALLAGRQGARAGRLTVITLPAVWLLTGLVGLTALSIPDLTWLGTAALLVLGLLVAADARLLPFAVAALAAAFAAVTGLLNGAALAAAGAGAPTLVGIVLAVLCVALLASAAVVPLRALWSRVAVRVAGSWVAAVGMLMLGWTLQAA